MMRDVDMENEKAYPLRNRGASVVGYVRTFVQAVEDCAMMLMNTSVNDLVSGESRSMLLTQP